jgi:peroxiredoxin
MKLNMMRWLAVALLSVAGLAVASAAENAGPGIAVGAKAPAFSLSDQNGKKRTLGSFLSQQKKVALVFYRSADWWPFCKKQLVELQGNVSKLEKAGIQVVGISYDSTEILSRFSKRSKITLPLLADVGSKVISAYGLRNESRKDGIPHPGTVIVGVDGKVIAKLFHEGYRKRHLSDELIKAAK